MSQSFDPGVLTCFNANKNIIKNDPAPYRHYNSNLSHIPVVYCFCKSGTSWDYWDCVIKTPDPGISNQLEFNLDTLSFDGLWQWHNKNSMTCTSSTYNNLTSDNYTFYGNTVPYTIDRDNTVFFVDKDIVINGITIPAFDYLGDHLEEIIHGPSTVPEIHIGDTTISAIKLGNIEISKIYLGTEEL